LLIVLVNNTLVVLRVMLCVYCCSLQSHFVSYICVASEANKGSLCSESLLVSSVAIVLHKT
jgi:hypothetical protein